MKVTDFPRVPILPGDLAISRSSDRPPVRGRHRICPLQPVDPEIKGQSETGHAKQHGKCVSARVSASACAPQPLRVAAQSIRQMLVARTARKSKAIEEPPMKMIALHSRARKKTPLCRQRRRPLGAAMLSTVAWREIAQPPAFQKRIADRPRHVRRPQGIGRRRRPRHRAAHGPYPRRTSASQTGGGRPRPTGRPRHGRIHEVDAVAPRQAPPNLCRQSRRQVSVAQISSRHVRSIAPPNFPGHAWLTPIARCRLNSRHPTATTSDKFLAMPLANISNDVYPLAHTTIGKFIEAQQRRNRGRGARHSSRRGILTARIINRTILPRRGQHTNSTEGERNNHRATPITLRGNSDSTI